jgi:hypothetical protein
MDSGFALRAPRNDEGDKISPMATNVTTRRANRLRDFSTPLSTLSEKNISVFPKQNHRYIRSHPVPPKGRIAVVTDAGRVAVDADGASDEGA